jgi:hypothetical protein
VAVQVDLYKSKSVLRESFGDFAVTSFTSVALGVKFHVTIPFLFLVLFLSPLSHLGAPLSYVKINLTFSAPVRLVRCLFLSL